MRHSIYKNTTLHSTWTLILALGLFSSIACKSHHSFLFNSIKFNPKHKPSEILMKERIKLENSANAYSRAQVKSRRERKAQTGYYSKGNTNKNFLQTKLKQRKKKKYKRIYR